MRNSSACEMYDVKMLIVGSWVTSTYEEPLYRALTKLLNVTAFKWGEYFGFGALSNKFDNPKSRLHSVWNRFQNKYILGPAIYRINADLVRRVAETKPDLIFIYRGTHVWPRTVKKLKKYSKVMVYNNDDPFSTKLPRFVYRNFLSSLPHADWIFSYREKNIDDYIALGFNNTSILRSNYLNEVHFPIDGVQKNFDVSFIGHFEDDGRDEILLKLVKETNCKLGLWGHNWESSKHYDLLRKFVGQEIKPIFGADYNRLINQSKIALVFFSKINSDGYTRRCFEIPAARTMMLCEYAPAAASLFEEGKEAEYFRNSDELVQKVRHYLLDESKISQIALGGRTRLLKDGHEISDRAKQILETFQQQIKVKR